MVVLLCENEVKDTFFVLKLFSDSPVHFCYLSLFVYTNYAQWELYRWSQDLPDNSRGGGGGGALASASA